MLWKCNETLLMKFNNCPHTLWTNLWRKDAWAILFVLKWYIRQTRLGFSGLNYLFWSLVLQIHRSVHLTIGRINKLAAWWDTSAYSCFCHKDLQITLPCKNNRVLHYIQSHLISPSPLQLWVKWKWGLTVYSISSLIVLSCSLQACQSCTF